MNEVYIYEIPGNPVTLARPRFGQNRVWDSQKQVKHNIQLFLERQHKKRPLFLKPLHMSVVFYIKPPQKSHREGFYALTKHDLDNLLKMVYDTGNKLIWRDDSIIVSTSALKVYSLNPRTVFKISELNIEEKPIVEE